MTLDGHIRRVLKDFDTLSVADTRPTVSGVDADMIAVNRSELPHAEVHHRTLIVYATGEPDEPPRLAWRIKVVGRGRATGHKIGDDCVIIDAHSGDTVRERSGNEGSVVGPPRCQSWDHRQQVIRRENMFWIHLEDRSCR